MHLIEIDSWTGTPWIENWRRIKSFTLNTPIIGVSDFSSLIEKIRNKKWRISGRFKNVYEQLDLLQAELQRNGFSTHDPVKYIAYLYFEEKTGLHKILEHLESNYWVKLNYGSFYHLVIHILWWELRDQTQSSTKFKRAKLRRRLSDWDADILNQRQSELYQESVAVLVDELIAKKQEMTTWFIEIAAEPITYKRVTWILRGYWIIEDSIVEIVDEFAVRDIRPHTAIQVINKVVIQLLQGSWIENIPQIERTHIYEIVRRSQQSENSKHYPLTAPE